MRAPGGGGSCLSIRKHDHFTPTREIKRHVRALARNHPEGWKLQGHVSPATTNYRTYRIGLDLWRRRPDPPHAAAPATPALQRREEPRARGREVRGERGREVRGEVLLLLMLLVVEVVLLLRVVRMLLVMLVRAGRVGKEDHRRVVVSALLNLGGRRLSVRPAGG